MVELEVRKRLEEYDVMLKGLNKEVVKYNREREDFDKYILNSKKVFEGNAEGMQNLKRELG